jgi:hypothetical protein
MVSLLLHLVKIEEKLKALLLAKVAALFLSLMAISNAIAFEPTRCGAFFAISLSVLASLRSG